MTILAEIIQINIKHFHSNKPNRNQNILVNTENR